MEANGRLIEAKGLKRFRGFKAGKRAMEANRRLQRSNNKCLWPECLVEVAARDLKRFKRFRGFKAGKRQA